MNIELQTIDTRKGTVDYIFGELTKCTHLQPGQKQKINLSLDLTKPEYILVEKSEGEGVYHLVWIKGHEDVIDDAFFVIPSDLVSMKAKVEHMVDMMTDHAEEDEFEKKCYEAYQLRWMIEHGYSLEKLMHIIVDRVAEEVEDDEDNAMTCADHVRQMADATRYEFLYDKGFGNSEVFASKDEFLGAEYLDVRYMRNLFLTMGDFEALADKYVKFTGNKDIYFNELP